MMLRLRVSFPDRPGALGQAARVLGTLGADILQVTVLERETGRAVDDFTVSWPGTPDAETVRDRLSAGSDSCRPRNRRSASRARCRQGKLAGRAETWIPNLRSKALRAPCKLVHEDTEAARNAQITGQNSRSIC